MTNQCHSTFTSGVSGHSTQVVAKQGLLSVKVLNSLNELVRVAEDSLSWGGTIQWSSLSYQRLSSCSDQLQAKSEHSFACPYTYQPRS